MLHRSLLTKFLVGGLLLATPILAQESTSELPPTFGDIIDVRVINLEVVVTEGKTRVRDLTSDDFRLLVDGEEVPIEYFTEVVGGMASDASAGASGTIPALAPGEAVGTRFLVFIDDVSALRPRRNRVLRKMVEQLPNMSPEDQMAVVAYDGQQIELLTSWTGSQPALARVFRKAEERPAQGLRQRLDTPSLAFGPSRGFSSRFNDPFFSRDPFFRYGSGFGATARRGSRTYNNADRVLDAATSTLRAFAKPPGRKVMLLLSGGWPISSESFFSSGLGYGAGGTDRTLMRPLADTANRLGYTLYPVDVNGSRSRGLGSAEFSTSRQARFFEDLSREQEWIEESGLVHLANETGGKAFLDGAGLNAFQRAVEDTRSYYWLGFTPTWQEDDRRHRIKVEVKRKGVKVRTRNSFSDLSRQTEVTMLVESAQLFDHPIPGEQAEMEVTFGEPQKGGFRKVVIPVRLEIPLDQVTLLPYDGGFGARLEVRVAATDDRGDRADIPVIPIEVRRAVEDNRENAFFELGLKLRRRPHELLISVHDPTTGNMLTKRVGLTL